MCGVYTYWMLFYVQCAEYFVGANKKLVDIQSKIERESSRRGMSSFVVASESEKKYTIEGCEANTRGDGRGNSNIRPYIVETSSSSLLLLSNGSSRVYLPNRSTDVLCSVKGEIVKPIPSMPSCGVVEVNVELGGSKQKRRCNKLEEMNISQVLSTLLLNTLHLDKLCIVPKRYCWKLFVDVFVLSCSGGNTMDACSMAVYSALNSTYLPMITPTITSTTNDPEDDVDGDNNDAIMDSTTTTNIVKQNHNKSGVIDDLLVDGKITEIPPGAEDCPITITVCRLGGSSKKNLLVVDCTKLEEESCASAKVSVSVDRSRRICGVHKCGQGSIPFRQLSQMTQLAVDVSVQLFDLASNSSSSSSSSSNNNTESTAADFSSLFSSPIEFR